ncbi:dentilisin complex subunit PrcA [Treponema sp. OMZ 799]|uniref:dentilisin complex subunit PrcA n=1 Tax=Treponema sp. OMZ 799 TaxID=2563668 RepID=UPI0020A2CCBB|nr:dentilisin complex subunit PrcA [Treponema sp. OMZ 799]UTC78888.1 dentilisin complex subunit PrcA [Treponema sp. OMZ 799]
MSQKKWNAFALFVVIVLTVLLGSCFHEAGQHFGPEDGIAFLDIFVVDSIGGTVVDGTKLNVIDCETNHTVYSSVSVSNGRASLVLTSGKKYDISLAGEKGKWAGSLIQDYYVDKVLQQKLTIFQFKHGQITRGVTPPRIEKVKIGNAVGADITDGHTMGNTEKKVYVEFTSEVGAVENVAWNGFGAKLGIGAVPSGSSGIYGTYTADSDPNDGIFKSEYVFNIEHASLPNGDTELIIVGYDIANNRVEKHIPVSFNKTPAAAPLSNAKFEDPFMIIERVPFTNNTFSTEPGQGLVQLGSGHEVMPQALNPIEGHNSSYMAAFVFGVVGNAPPNNPVPIMGFDVFRREKGSTEGFKFVSRTHYDRPKTETRPRLGVHQGFDTSSELEEGKEYEYKIKAFTATDILESPVLTGKVMEAFTYSLKAPENRKKISVATAANMSYSCTISNKKLLTKEEADWCDLGLLILDGQGKAVFGSKFRYVFDRFVGTSSIGPDLLIYTIGFAPGNDPVPFSYKQYLATPLHTDYSINSLDDLITVDSSRGIITITDKFLKIAQFNLVSGSPMKYQAGVNYQWDIQDWGKDPYRLDDDRALRIVKMYGSNQSRSMGNNSSSGSNAVNGRFTFVITE